MESMDVQLDCEIVLCQASNSSTPLKPFDDRSLKVSKKSNSTAPKMSAEERKLEKAEKERRRSELLEEREKKKEQLLREKEERQQKLEERKLEKEKLNAQRLAAKLERDEAKLKKENERKQQELEKLAAKQKFEEEKRQKELEKVAQKAKREEEKRQQELEKQRLEDEKKAKEERKRQDIAKFFVKVEKQKHTKEQKVKFEGYAPGFDVKKGMFLAPLIRRPVLTNQQAKEFDCLRDSQSLAKDELYLEVLKSGQHSTSSYSSTIKLDTSNSSDDVIVMASADGANIGGGDHATKKLRPKFLKFHENYRPPYYGTWRKRCEMLKHGRRPFAKAVVEFDYDEDSDDEWEAEPEDAEECKSDEEDDDKDSNAADSEEDAWWLVDHGYLSSDEEVDGSSREAPENQMDMDAETRRERMKIKAEAWKSEKLSKKWEKLKPVVIGPFFEDDVNSLPGPFAELLRSMRAISVVGSLPVPFMVPEQTAAVTATTSGQQTVKNEKVKKRASTNCIDNYCRPTTPAKKPLVGVISHNNNIDESVAAVVAGAGGN